MRFVPVKSAERQAALLDHKTRDFLVRQRTQLVNTIRAHLAEFGIVVAKGIHSEEDQKTIRWIVFPTSDRLLAVAGDLPDAARPAVDLLAEQLRQTEEKIEAVTTELEAAQKDDPLARRLATIPGVGTITASAIAASRQRRASRTMPEVGNFRSARDYAAWLGLTPQPHSSGGKERLGRISKAGNRCIRRLLYLGAMAQISARRRGGPGTDWLWHMLQRKPVRIVAVALANRMARVVWALIRSGESYRANPA